MDFLHRARRVAEMLEDVVRVHLIELPVLKRPRKDPQIVDDIHAGELHDVMVQPVFLDDMAAAEVEFGFQDAKMILFLTKSNTSTARRRASCASPPAGSGVSPG